MPNSPKNRIYLDYASLTPIDLMVVKEMAKYSTMDYANVSSLYKEGVAAKKALEVARIKCAQFINAHPDEIIFTSGGTEANNLAIIGAIEKLREQGVEYKDMHVVTSVIEHSSVREAVNYLNGREVKITAIGVDSRGVVDLEQLKKSICPNTVVVSIMTVNNEIGTIQPIRDIAKIIRNARKNFNRDAGKSVSGLTSDGQNQIRDTFPEVSPMVGQFQTRGVSSSIVSAFNFQSEVEYPLFHTDAAQAALFNELKVEKLGIDLMTIDSSKVYGPRGVGFLFKKRNVPLANIIHGGGQESGLRSGTEPLPQIMGFAKALDMAATEMNKEIVRIGKLRAQFIAGLIALAKGIRINGVSAITAVAPTSKTFKSKTSTDLQSPHILNISIPKIDSEYFLLQLDAAGIACSTKSSCLRDEDESYVLKAIGADSKTSLRFSFGRFTTPAHIKSTLKVIKDLLIS